MTPEQCKAARALLKIDQSELAKRSGIARATIIDFEKGTRRPRTTTLDALRTALQKSGIEFLNDGVEGVFRELDR